MGTDISTKYTQGTFWIPVEKGLAEISTPVQTDKKLTIISQKIKDLCIETLQMKWSDKHINIEKVYDEAATKLKRFFNEENLVVEDEMRPKQKDMIKKMRNYFIRQEMIKLIPIDDMYEIHIPFEEFVHSIGSEVMTKAINREIRYPIGRVITDILNAQMMSLYEWKEDVPNADYTGFDLRIAKTFAIPTIKFTISEEGKQYFDSIDELIKSKIQDKEKYIKCVSIQFDRETLANHLLVSSQFAILHRKQRQALNTSYTFRLDEIIRSIEWQQIEKGNIKEFEVDELMKKFGVLYKSYGSFKLKVLTPAISDFNNTFNDLEVEIGEKRVNKKIEKIFFKIRKKGAVYMSPYKGAPFYAYYIASQHYYFNKNDTVGSFDDFLQMVVKDLIKMSDDSTQAGESSLGARTLAGWKDESAEAYEKHRFFQFLENTVPGKEFMDQRNYKYDEDMLALKQNGEIITIAGMAITTNPISSFDYIKQIDPVLIKKMMGGFKK